jgi:hypothetical protein
MRRLFRSACVLLALASLTFGLQPAARAQAKQPSSKPAGTTAADADLSALLESKVKTEWDAFKNKTPQPYADLLADDYISVETDNLGARNKVHAVKEVQQSVVVDYTLSLFKTTMLGPDATLVVYESFMRFPRTATRKFLRLYVSEIWVKRSGQWKMLHHQETRAK